MVLQLSSGNMGTREMLQACCAQRSNNRAGKANGCYAPGHRTASSPKSSVPHTKQVAM